MAAVAIERRIGVAAAGVTAFAIQNGMSPYQRESAFLMHLPETRFIRPGRRAVAAAAGVSELVFVNVLVATETSGFRFGEVQRPVAGAATDGGVPAFQREFRRSMVELHVGAHGRPVVGDMAELAIEVNRAVRILAGLAFQCDRSRDRREKSGHQENAQPPFPRILPRMSSMKRAHGFIPG